MTANRENSKADKYRVGRVATSAFKERVRLAFDRVCEYCGAAEPPDPTIQQIMNVDRIVPGAHGGRYLPINVTCACRSCNSKKRDRLSFCGPVRTLAIMERARHG